MTVPDVLALSFVRPDWSVAQLWMQESATPISVHHEYSTRNRRYELTVTLGHAERDEWAKLQFTRYESELCWYLTAMQVWLANQFGSVWMDCLLEPLSVDCDVMQRILDAHIQHAAEEATI